MQNAIGFYSKRIIVLGLAALSVGVVPSPGWLGLGASTQTFLMLDFFAFHPILTMVSLVALVALVWKTSARKAWADAQPDVGGVAYGGSIGQIGARAEFGKLTLCSERCAFHVLRR